MPSRGGDVQTLVTSWAMQWLPLCVWRLQVFNIADDTKDVQGFRRPWADEEDNEINEFDADGNWFDWDADQWGAFKSYNGGYTRVYTQYGEDAQQKVSLTKEKPVVRHDGKNVESTKKYINQCAQDSRTIDFKVDSGAAVSAAGRLFRSMGPCVRMRRRRTRRGRSGRRRRCCTARFCFSWLTRSPSSSPPPFLSAKPPPLYTNLSL